MGNVADDLEAILGARRELINVVAEKEKVIKGLREDLKEAQGWWLRLSDKVKSLEREQPEGCVLDSWDEEYFFMERAVIAFGRRADGKRRISITPKVGSKAIVRSDQLPKGESMLRAVILKANGRTRAV